MKIEKLLESYDHRLHRLENRKPHAAGGWDYSATYFNMYGRFGPSATEEPDTVYYFDRELESSNIEPPKMNDDESLILISTPGIYRVSFEFVTRASTTESGFLVLDSWETGTEEWFRPPSSVPTFGTIAGDTLVNFSIPDSELYVYPYRGDLVSDVYPFMVSVHLTYEAPPDPTVMVGGG